MTASADSLPPRSIALAAVATIAAAHLATAIDRLAEILATTAEGHEADDA